MPQPAVRACAARAAASCCSTFGRLRRSNRSAAMLHSATCSQGGTVNFTTTDGLSSVMNMAVDQVDDLQTLLAVLRGQRTADDQLGHD